MTQFDHIKRLIEILRPRARFVAVTHSNQFIDETAQLGDGFYYVNLYDEQIDSNVITPSSGKHKNRIIMIHNTYLSSFSYNLLLCWFFCFRDDKENNLPNLNKLLKHNFKKFFAEQMLSFHNNTFSRAIFLETLLYEQFCMIPVFEAKLHDQKLNEKAEIASQLMSSLLSLHELGHVFLNKTPKIWDDLTQNYEVARSLFDYVTQSYPKIFIEEFKCDIISVVSCLQEYKSKVTIIFCLRAIVFAFVTFAVLFSLTKSAKKTATDQKSLPDEIDFNNIQKKQANYEYTTGFDIDFIERAKLVTKFCELIAQKNVLTLFDESDIFPLPPTLLDDLLNNINIIMENSDENARNMSLLMAESLNSHPKGLEYLVLRSKTFSFGNNRNLDGSLRVEV